FGDGIQNAAHDLGLGKATGIPLSPDAGGRIPDPESRKRLHDQLPKAYPEGRWFAGDNVNLAIAQGETVVTPIQLANAYATFANGGTVFAPRVAMAVKDGKKTVRTFGPIVSHKVDLPPAIRDPIMAGFI